MRMLPMIASTAATDTDTETASPRTAAVLPATASKAAAAAARAAASSAAYFAGLDPAETGTETEIETETEEGTEPASSSSTSTSTSTSTSSAASITDTAATTTTDYDSSAESDITATGIALTRSPATTTTTTTTTSTIPDKAQSDSRMMMSPGSTAATRRNYKTNSTADLDLKVDGIFSPIVADHQYQKLSQTPLQQLQQQQQQQQEEDDQFQTSERRLETGTITDHDQGQTQGHTQRQGQGQGQGHGHGHGGFGQGTSRDGNHPQQHWQYDGSHPNPSTNASSTSVSTQSFTHPQLSPRLQQKNGALSLDTDRVNATEERRNLSSRGISPPPEQEELKQDPSSSRTFFYSPTTATTPTAPKKLYESFDFENTHLPETEDNHKIMDGGQIQVEDNGEQQRQQQQQFAVRPRTERRRNPNREFSFAPGMFQGMLSSASLDDQRTIHLPPTGEFEPGGEGGGGGIQVNDDNTFHLTAPRSSANHPSGRNGSYLTPANTNGSGYLSANGFLDEYTPSSLTGSCVDLGLDSNPSNENDGGHHMHRQQQDSHHNNINGYDEYDTPRSLSSSSLLAADNSKRHGASATDLHSEENGDSDATPTYLPFHYAKSDTQVHAQAHTDSRTRSQSHLPPQLRHFSQQQLQQQQQQSKPSRTNTDNTETTSASPFYTPLETPEHSSTDRENTSSFPISYQHQQQPHHQSNSSAHSTPTTPTATHTTAAYMSQPPYPPTLHVNGPQLPPLEVPKPERPLHARPQFSLSTPTSPIVKPSFSKEDESRTTPTQQSSSMASNAGNGLPSSLQIPSAPPTSSGHPAYRPSSQHDVSSHENTNNNGSWTSQQTHSQSPPPPTTGSTNRPRRSTTSSTSAPRRASVSLVTRRNSRSQPNDPNNPTSPAGATESEYEDNGHRLSHSQSQPRLRPLTRVETFRTQQRRLSRSRRRRREEEDDDKVMVGTKVDQNHQNFVTAYNMLTGIRFTVSRTNAKIDRPLKDEDFDACFKFSFDVAGRELTPSAKYDFKFKDYAPWVFRHLRARFKLDPADYLMSLTSKYILSELGSPGKSGSFFYFSRDYKYIIKTIHHSEHKLLRRILRDYYEHVDKNPNTLISQFYGLHRVKMAYGRKIHFVVMNNLFPPHRDIHQMFDLKGSTVGRDYREEDLARNPRATMKDLNWLRREKRLHCGPLRKDVFMTQVKRDVALLQRLNIMDYSLLVGMHDTRKGNDEQLRDRALQVYQPGTKAGQLKGLGNGTEEQARQSADSSVTGQDSVLAQAQGPRLSNLEQGSVSSSQSQSQSQRYPRPSRQSFREISIPLERMKGKSVDEILDQTKQLVFYSEEGGFRATNQAGDAIGEIYYLGIIDCLTTYGVVKKAENFWKGLSHNRNEISPIPPVSYANRFIEFIEHITKSPEQHAQEREERERERERQRALGLRPSLSSDGPADSNSNFFHSPNGKGKGSVDGSGPHHQHIFTSMNDPSGSSAAVLPVVEEVPGESNASIRSQHASSMQIYENLMKGTSSRYEVRLSSGPGLPGSSTSPSNVRRPAFTLPDSLNMEGNPYGFPPGSAGTGETGDEGRAGSAGSAGSDSSYGGGGGPGGHGLSLSHGHDYDYGPGSGAGHAAGAGAGGPFAAYDEHHTNVGGQQQPLHPEIPNFLRPGQHDDGASDGDGEGEYSASHQGQYQHDIQPRQHRQSGNRPQPYRPYLYEDNYAYDTDATPPSSSTMHVPHMPPPPDSLPPPPVPQRTPPHPPSPPPSWEREREREREQRAHHRSTSGTMSSESGMNSDAAQPSTIAKNEMFLESFPKPPLSPTVSRS